MLKAGAMTYAIILSIIVGAFCLSLVWISTAHRNTQAVIKNKERLLVNCLSAVDFTLKMPNHTEPQLLTLNNDSVYTFKSNWGVFSYSNVTAIKNKKELSRSFLSGMDPSEQQYPALYLANNDGALKITGNTVLKGEINVPKKGIERAFIEGKNFSNKKLYIGTKKTSEKKLPSLKSSIVKLSYDEIVNDKEVTFLDQLPLDSSFSFQTSTHVFKQSIPINIREVLSGNLIIFSSDSIFVSNESRLDNVILYAPSVRFEKGFEGTVQVFAEKNVVLEENVILKYPSSIYLKDENPDFRRSDTVKVKLEKNAHLLGGILITSTSPDFRNLVKLDVKKNASVIGLIYNQGETQLRGKIIGSIFTQKFYLNTKSSSYTNHLIDAEIDGFELPEYFIFPSWLDETTEKEALIKWL
ncbi:MAG: hypothetical protein WED10_05255 [Brumimicrobium sp.]